MNLNLQFLSVVMRGRIGALSFVPIFCGILIGCGPSDGEGETEPRSVESAGSEIGAELGRPETIDSAILKTRSFGEAPMLAERVATGILPPVSDRLPENPFIVTPADRIGDYGGTLHRFIATEVIEEEGINKSLNDGLFRYENHLPGKIHPNLAESYEFSPDSRELIIRLRPGVRWSDGTPFTTADILFWYYDMTFDQEARTQPLFPSIWLVGGEPVKMEAIDATTLRVSAEKPLARILNAFCHNRFAYPKHVLSREHPRYNPDADYGKFRKITSQARLVLQPGLPRLSAWVPVRWVSGQRVVYERNPYYWKVDTAGNQLPYADRLEFSVVEDRNVMLLKFLSGEIDFFGRYARPENYFPLKQAEAAGKIKVGLMGPADIVCFYLNWDAPGRNQREVIRDIRVRQALSHAIDREEITEILFHGLLLEPCGYSLNRGSPVFSEEAYRKFTEFDPARAEALLDEAGTIDSDRDGWREFKDGSRFELTLDYSSDDSGGANLAELVRNYWEEIGIKIHLNGGKSEIIYVRVLNGDFEITLRAISAPSDPAQRPNFWAITSPQNPFWHRNASNEGPDWLREATVLLEGVLSSVDEEQIRINLERFRDLHTDNIPAIGIGSQYRVWAASTRLGNVPFDLVYDNDYHGWGGSLHLPQVFIKREEQ